MPINFCRTRTRIVININYSIFCWKNYSFRFKLHIYTVPNPAGTLRCILDDLTSILHRYVEGQTSTNFHVISTYFFDVISLIQKSMSFPCTFFDIISMVEKSTSFPLTFFDVNLMVKKSTLFTRTFFRRNLDGQKFDVVFG